MDENVLATAKKIIELIIYIKTCILVQNLENGRIWRAIQPVSYLLNFKLRT